MGLGGGGGGGDVAEVGERGIRLERGGGGLERGG